MGSRPSVFGSDEGEDGTVPTAQDAAPLLRTVVAAAVQATDADALLEQVAGLLVGVVGDVVLADRLEEPDLLVRVAALGLGGPLPLREGPGPELPRPRRSSAAAGGLLPRLLASPAGLLHLDDAALTALGHGSDPLVLAQVALARRVGGRRRCWSPSARPSGRSAS